jgi:hypothetical protein
MKKIHPYVIRAGVALMVLALLAVPLASRAAAATAATTTLTFKPIADATVKSSYPNTDFGSALTLRVDASPNVHNHLKFSVSGLNGATITSAKLRFYAKSSSSSGLTAHPVSSNSWSESTINYNNMPAMGSAIATSAAVSAGTWVTINVSSYVKSQGTWGFAVTTPGSTAISLASRESGANAPRLVLTLGSTSTHACPELIRSHQARVRDLDGEQGLQPGVEHQLHAVYHVPGQVLCPRHELLCHPAPEPAQLPDLLWRQQLQHHDGLQPVLVLPH